MSPVCCAAWLTRRWMRPGAARLPPPLDEPGRRQAQRLGSVLGPRGLAAVFSSPLLRARQTAQPVGGRAGLEVAVDQCLLDRDYGPWTGISHELVTDRWG